MKYFYCFEKIHFLDQNGVFERFKNSCTSYWSTYNLKCEMSTRKCQNIYFDPLCMLENSCRNYNKWIKIDFIYIAVMWLFRYQNGSKFDFFKESPRNDFCWIALKSRFSGHFPRNFRGEKVDFYVTILTFIKNVWNFISVMYHWKTKSAMVRHSVTFCDKVNDSDHSRISSPTKRILNKVHV